MALHLLRLRFLLRFARACPYMYVHVRTDCTPPPLTHGEVARTLRPHILLPKSTNTLLYRCPRTGTIVRRPFLKMRVLCSRALGGQILWSVKYIQVSGRSMQHRVHLTFATLLYNRAG